MSLARPVAIVALLVLFTAPALAQDDGGMRRDPAIRSLSKTRSKSSADQGVEIPTYVRPIARPADQLPPGTTGPNSRTFEGPR